MGTHNSKGGSTSSRKSLWLHIGNVLKRCVVEQVRTEEEKKADKDKKREETTITIYMDWKAASVQHKADKKLISKVRKYGGKDEVFAQTQK